MMNKPPFNGTILPWHQDVNKNWPTIIQPRLAIWFSLDKTSSLNGSLEIIPKSHKNGVIGDGHMLSEEMTSKYAPDEKCMTIESEPGDVLFFDSSALARAS